MNFLGKAPSTPWLFEVAGSRCGARSFFLPVLQGLALDPDARLREGSREVEGVEGQAGPKGPDVPGHPQGSPEIAWTPLIPSRA